MNGCFKRTAGAQFDSADAMGGEEALSELLVGSKKASWGTIP
jgi:hypothetical protein